MCAGPFFNDYAGAVVMSDATDWAESMTPVLNRRIDLPFLSENTESAVFLSILRTVAESIPTHARGVLLEVADGISDEERARYTEATMNVVTASLVNELPAWARSLVVDSVQSALEPIVGRVFEFAQKGLALDQDLPK